ncbi:MAG: hypothetical protein QOJ03_1113, partial [Frankiaceae bacterium]|nr:hypothetical protein [Frankiaceae bacterium]
MVTDEGRTAPEGDDLATQQIRRPPPPAPRPGNLTPGSAGGAPSGTTEVLSIDELLDAADPTDTPAEAAPIETAPVETAPIEAA